MAGERILIVEDESIVAKDIQNSLKNLGYVVPAIVSTGEEAVVKAHELKPDLVLMDVMLKGQIDGIEAAEQIRAQSHIPVVFLTAYTDDQTLKRAKVSEAFGYLLKPFEDRELRTTIEMALYQCIMKRKLRESREWFETTLRCLGDAVVATDTHDCIQMINATAEALTGWPRADAIGRKLTDIFCLKDRPQSLLLEQFNTKILQGNEATEFGKDSILIARDGHPIPIDHSIAPIVGGEGNILGIVVIFRDVSDRHLSEDRERDLQKRLSRSKRMESLGILAGGVAHDLNNILGPIIDYPDLIMKNLPADSALRADLEIIKNSSHKAIEMVHDLLTLGRIGHVPMEPIALNEIIDACMSSTEFRTLQTKFPLVMAEHQLAPDLHRVMGSRQHLYEVVMNLLINAFDAMPSGGRLMLTTSMKQLNKALEGYEVIEPGKYAVLHFTDTGRGIGEENINQIFEPFFTKRTLGWEVGSGLGLAVVYGVVKDHKGFLNVTSKVGTGSDFDVYFPVSEVPAGIAAHKTEPAAYHGRETILVVDDDEEQRKTTLRWLRSHGYKVLAAANGKSAFETFQTTTGSLEEPIDLVLLDMIMADEWDGLDTYRNILAINPSQKAVIVSGFAITGRIKEVLRLGAGQYLQKPYTMAELGKVVRLELDKPANTL
ncbi:MAG: response regulator [Verrucomicrobia bacterium]|nr:response regulator [Verrucomicrobiota bacterium]MCG2679186.1 response regulator [Kiritimatiellia bacterium]MBU4247938.1 response regulator [Verrucomicrobiota bacterium]MBU4289670.1 response regulator [Verrucomicrobiota bacterium]MBU4428136.1 response regulator [Verrucomicrobiota bacterium]